MRYRMFGSTAYLYDTGSVHGVPTQHEKSFIESLGKILTENPECKSLFSIANDYQAQSKRNFNQLGFKSEQRGRLWFFKIDAKSLMGNLSKRTRLGVSKPDTGVWTASADQTIRVGSVVYAQFFSGEFVHAHSESHIGIVKYPMGRGQYQVELLDGTVGPMMGSSLEVIRQVNYSVYVNIPKTQLKLCVTSGGELRIKNSDTGGNLGSTRFFKDDGSIDIDNANKLIKHLQQRTNKE